MNKMRFLYGILILVTLLGLFGCKQEALTTTVMSTITAQAPTITATSTITGAAQTVTVTETRTVTSTKTATATTTTSSSTTTTKTTTTSTPTTTTTIEFTPVTSPDGKLQVFTAILVGGGTGMDASRIGLRGIVRNLSDETLKARVTVEFLSPTGSLGSFSTELPITIGPGAEKNYVIETNLNRVEISGFNVSVVVIP